MLASQDDAETRLCPHLQPPTGPSDATKSLIFGPKYTVPAHDAPTPAHTGPALKVNPTRVIRGRVAPKIVGGQTTQPSNPSFAPGSRKGSPNRWREDDTSNTGAPSLREGTSEIRITEKSASKDYRSFAANVFGSVAFKMLEWLAPNNMEAMSKKVAAVGTTLDTGEEAQAVPSGSDGESERPNPRSAPLIPELGNQAEARDNSEVHRCITSKNEVTGVHQRVHSEPPISNGNAQGLSLPQRRSSNTRIRTSSVSKSQSRVSEPLVDSIADETGPISPGIHAPQSDKVSKGLIRPPSTITRNKSQLTENDVHIHPIPERNASGSPSPHSHVDEHLPQADGANSEETLSSVDSTPSRDTPDESQETLLGNDGVESTSELDSYLPQSLSRLSPQAINFICDVLQDDATSERHLLEPQTISEFTKPSPRHQKVWRRKRKCQTPYPQNMQFQWKLFVEQSIFHVLSDPQALLDSFSGSNGAIDSQMLWYCMLRLTRVAPNLVFDSLWIASASLFAPPRRLQSTRSPTSKIFQVPQKSFTNAEAALLMSICFHALIAAAPLVEDSRQLNDMSRIRAHGLSLAGGGAVARQPVSLCLQYEDAFTDDMALRLARRLLRVIPTRRYFDELVELDLDVEDGAKEPDVLELLLSHLESSAQSAMRFSKAERSVHEKRVPILIMDWARAVMLHEWEGKPDVSGDGPFGGALSLMTAMCK